MNAAMTALPAQRIDAAGKRHVDLREQTHHSAWTRGRIAHGARPERS